MTSNSAGRGDELHRRVVDEHVGQRDVVVLRLVDDVDDLAPLPRGLEDVGLVDARDLLAPRRAASKATRAMRSTSSTEYSHSVAGAARGARLLAEVDAAGQLAHDEQVGALDALALERARVVAARARAAPGAGWRTGRGPCAARAGPARDAARRGRSCPTSGRRRRPAGRRRRCLQAASVSSVSAVPWTSIAAPPKRCSSNVEVLADACAAARARGSHDLGADPVAGQGDDCWAWRGRLSVRREELGAAVRPAWHDRRRASRSPAVSTRDVVAGALDGGGRSGGSSTTPARAAGGEPVQRLALDLRAAVARRDGRASPRLGGPGQ